MRLLIKKCLNCGTAHEWEYDQPTLKELRFIKARTDLSGREFGEGLIANDPDAVTALMAILHQRSGVELRWEDVDLDFDDFEVIPDADEIEADGDQGKDAPAESTPSGEPDAVV